MEDALCVLELYSGIGGLHFALEESGIPHVIVGAVDINNVANDIYRHNFPSTKIIQRSIESLTVKELDSLSPDLIHMSPPCQPFVRVGKQQDADDRRTKSFLHLIEIIPRLKKQPAYLFLENVKGFDTSETRRVLLEMLETSGYICQEFLLSPLQFGIPNSRLRYYLLAKLKPRMFGFHAKTEIWEDIPDCVISHMTHLAVSAKQHVEVTTNQPACGVTSGTNAKDCEETVPSKLAQNVIIQEEINHSEPSHEKLEKGSGMQTCDKEQIDRIVGDNPSATREETSADNEAHIPLYERCEAFCSPVGNYLETGPEEYIQRHEVPDKFLPRFWVMDIVRPNSRNTCCFTKRYGHHIEGAGSVLQTVDCPQVDLSQYKRDRIYTPEVEKGVADLRLRFFTPREIANFMCFPQKFSFPGDVSTIQCYRVLGNSLNVHVVSVLLQLLILGENKS